MNTTLDLTELNIQVGRLFMAGIPGPTLDKGTESLIREFCLGGVILFNRNIKDPVQLALLCKDLQDKALYYHGIPLFIAVDQEGGVVTRLKKPFTQFPGNKAIANDKEPLARAREFALVTAREMRLVGLNMDLAPVLDVCGNECETHLKGRTFGDDPRKVAELGSTVIKILQENAILATAKHFPGLGKATLDPHNHLPTIRANTKDIHNVDLMPFRAAMSENVSTIMSSHAVYTDLEPDLPATISYNILTRLIREEMGFNGLIMTDDLEMGSIRDNWGVAEGAVAAFEAGADILLICHNQNNILEAINLLRDRIISEKIEFKRVLQSLERIEKAKSSFIRPDYQVSIKDVRRYFVEGLTTDMK